MAPYPLHLFQGQGLRLECDGLKAKVCSALKSLEDLQESPENIHFISCFLNERIIVTTNICWYMTIRENQNKTAYEQYEQRSEASSFLPSCMLVKQL